MTDKDGGTRQMVLMVDDPVVAALFDPVAEVLGKAHILATGDVPLSDRSPEDQALACTQRIDVLAALLAAHIATFDRSPETTRFTEDLFEEIREMVQGYHDVKATGSSTVIQ